EIRGLGLGIKVLGSGRGLGLGQELLSNGVGKRASGFGGQVWWPRVVADESVLWSPAGSWAESQLSVLGRETLSGIGQEWGSVFESSLGVQVGIEGES
ncbi:hypothetical protein HAX54_004345, partial [Datura stramonium]|nr:hypothetical protein [Datura stramonium]